MNFIRSSIRSFNQKNPIVFYTFQRTLKFISWIPVIFVISEHVSYVGIVDGISMKPTFNPDISLSKDRVLLWKFNVKNIDNLKVNDVVFLKSPIDPTQIHTKRIKGIALDSIIPRYPDTRSKVLIPLNHIWVEGDNIHSIDSNTYGPISTGMVVAKAVWILWPLNRFGPVPNTGGRECRERQLRYPGAF
jgi:inner membrane protease subunit 2